MAGSFESGKIPKYITLEINYYQVTKNQKRIMEAFLTFDQFIAPTSSQLLTTNPAPFLYNLQIAFTPMTQTEITIKFGFPWTLYLILYVGICSFASIIIGIFWLYNWIMTR